MHSGFFSVPEVGKNKVRKHHGTSQLPKCGREPRKTAGKGALRLFMDPELQLCKKSICQDGGGQGVGPPAPGLEMHVMEQDCKQVTAT